MSEESERQLVADNIVFGEGPRWHDDHFWFSDIGASRVYRLEHDGQLTGIADVPGRPSGLGWRPDGTLLISSMHDHVLLGRREGRLEEIADLSQWCGGDMNDMVVDAVGRAYVGNIGFDLTEDPIQPKTTGLVRVDPDGSARCVAEGLMAPNGMVITPDGKTLIVGESGAACLTAFDISGSGDLEGRREFARIPGGAVPDGICLDAEGAIWIGSPTTNEFLRVREGGEIANRISTGDRVAIACMLGGTDRKTLFLITAPTSNIQTSIPLRAGRIESIRVDVAGAGRP